MTTDFGQQFDQIMATFISQLRQYAPVFNGRVGGAADFDRGLVNYNTSMPLPAAYVLPREQDAEPNQLIAGGLLQQIAVHVGVVVELDAQRDRRGQDPVMGLGEIGGQIFGSVLGIVIGNCRMSPGKPVEFARAGYLALDRARLFYEWVFSFNWQLTDADGFQPVYVDLVSVELDGFKAPVTAGDMPAFVALIPMSDSTPPAATDGPWPAVVP